MISVGIDVSKNKSTVCILQHTGEFLVDSIELSHTVNSLDKLCKLLNSYEDEIKVVMEATGNYHLPVLLFLKEKGFFVSVVNPMLMKKFANVTIRKVKTDKMDAVKIASYGINYWKNLKNYVIQDEKYAELRELSRYYFECISQRIAEKVTLKNLLDKVMPGIDQVFSGKNANPERDKLTDFVHKYWHYDNITKMSLNKFTESYKRWCEKEEYRFSIDKATDIYTTAKNGIPTLSSKMTSTKIIILDVTKRLCISAKSLNIILARMQEIAKSLPEYDTVLKMTGVGEKLAPRIIAEIGNIENFHSAKALVAYAGIDAPPYQSGNFYGTNRKISKRGSRYLRKTGYEIMKSIKTHVPTTDTAVYNFILKKESEGKSKKQAKIAGLNKFLHIYYARVKEVYNSFS